MLLEPKPVLNRRLPGLVVEEELYDSVSQTARRLNISRGELIRRSLRFFLSEAVNQTYPNDNPVDAGGRKHDYR